MPIEVNTPPTIMAVDLPMAKSHLVIDETTTATDVLVQKLIESATSWVEGFTQRKLLAQTVTWYRDRFTDEDRLRLPLGKVKAVNSVKYIATDGTLTTWDVADYTATLRDPGYIWPNYGNSWPTIRAEPEAVRVEYQVGWDHRNDVPGDITHAMLLLIGHGFEHREESIAGTIIGNIPHGVKDLLRPWKAL